MAHGQTDPAATATPLEAESHLLELESGLHRRPVLHLLSQSSVPGTGQALLLHRGADIHRHRVFVLQHVSKASRSNKMGGGFK